MAFVLVIGILLFGVLVNGFRGRHFRSDAAALHPVDVPLKPYTVPSI